MTEQDTKRVSSLDGLRGILAFSVFFHHAFIYWLFLNTGRFHLTKIPFIDKLGQASVAMFFMITAYLFWGKLRSGGLNTLQKWLSLYIGRLFRIGPVYLLAILVMFGVVAVRTDFHLHQPLMGFLKGVLRWLSFGMASGYDLNGYLDTKLITAGVTWSLYYEWLFYFSLPVMGFIVCIGDRLNKWFSTIFPVVIFIGSIIWRQFFNGSYEFVFVILFSIGMMAVDIVPRLHLNRFKPIFVSLFILVILKFVYFMELDTYREIPCILLGIAFFCIVSGNNIFNLLTNRFTVFLGDISYDVYLLHGLILNMAFRIPSVRDFAMLTPIYYLDVIAILAVLVIIVSYLSHHYIEKPCIALGHRLTGKLLKKKG